MKVFRDKRDRAVVQQAEKAHLLEIHVLAVWKEVYKR